MLPSLSSSRAQPGICLFSVSLLYCTWLSFSFSKNQSMAGHEGEGCQWVRGERKHKGCIHPGVLSSSASGDGFSPQCPPPRSFSPVLLNPIHHFYPTSDSLIRNPPHAQPPLSLLSKLRINDLLCWMPEINTTL